MCVSHAHAYCSFIVEQVRKMEAQFKSLKTSIQNVDTMLRGQSAASSKNSLILACVKNDIVPEQWKTLFPLHQQQTYVA